MTASNGTCAILLYQTCKLPDALKRPLFHEFSACSETAKATSPAVFAQFGHPSSQKCIDSHPVRRDPSGQHISKQRGPAVVAVIAAHYRILSAQHLRKRQLVERWARALLFWPSVAATAACCRSNITSYCTAEACLHHVQSRIPSH